MTITSPAFSHLTTIPVKYTCEGEDISPPLDFLDVPEKAQSLALIVDDPDAPISTWVHWLVWNINPKITKLGENASFGNTTLMGTTSFGYPGYGGPCPPQGQHRYFFKLYALNTVLGLGTDATARELYQAMEGHILSRAELIGLYEKIK